MTCLPAGPVLRLPSGAGISTHSRGLKPFGCTLPFCAKSPAIEGGSKAGSTPVSSANFLRSSLRRSCSAFFAARWARLRSAASDCGPSGAVVAAADAAVAAGGLAAGGAGVEPADVEAGPEAVEELMMERKQPRRAVRSSLELNKASLLRRDWRRAVEGAIGG